MITTALYPDSDVEFLGSVPPHVHMTAPQDNWDMMDDAAAWSASHLDAVDAAIEAHEDHLACGHIRTYHGGRA